LVYIYRRLAIREEREVAAELGSVYNDYANRTARFLPHLHAAPPPLAGRR
jgi:protein-S-isoprenylcysteine O-methyltransferase Ste14